MKSPNNKKPSESRIDQVRHDLKPVILGLRAALLLMSQGKNIEAQELVKESDERLTQLVAELADSKSEF